MAYLLYTDILTPVTLNPEYDFTREDAKVEDRHRTRSSARYFYRWSKYTRFVFSINYLNATDKDIINGWWDANTPLFFKDEDDPEVFEVCLVNDSTPFGEFNMPYNTLFKGTVELESY